MVLCYLTNVILLCPAFLRFLVKHTKILVKQYTATKWIYSLFGTKCIKEKTVLHSEHCPHGQLLFTCKRIKAGSRFISSPPTIAVVWWFLVEGSCTGKCWIERRNCIYSLARSKSFFLQVSYYHSHFPFTYLHDWIIEWWGELM